MIKIFAVNLIKCYQFLISPFLGQNCRFETSCSKNMVNALNKFGVVVGFYYGLAQILKCSPWYNGGLDV